MAAQNPIMGAALNPIWRQYSSRITEQNTEEIIDFLRGVLDYIERGEPG